MKNKVIIIAEAGVNHNGNIDTAMALIDAAANAGADYVKFQTFKSEKNISATAPKAEYQVKNAGAQESQLEMVRKLELSEEHHLVLQNYCEQKGISFLSTAFDNESIDLLHQLGIKLAKIPSGEITNLPYLRKIAPLFSHFVLSTGMADITEIGTALNVLRNAGVALDHITVLHCNTEYPTPMEDVNLRAMLHIQQEFGVQVGYSDHTLGIEVPIAAVALGATVIEKHFTMDRNMEGPDHRASLEPAELTAMVSAIRNIEKAVNGDGVKKASPSEEKNKAIARKSIHISRAVKAGELLTAGDLITLRPGTGISPMEWDKIIGKKAAVDLPEGHLLKWSDINV
jgi:N-acetylneuraminate synthase